MAIFALAALATMVACNMVTGADDISFGDTGDEYGGMGGASSGMGGQTTSGSGGAGAEAGSTSSSSSTSASSTSASSSSTTSSTSSTGCGGAGPATTPLDSEEQSFLVLINNYRQQNGLGSLTNCTSLSRAAQGHSEDMWDQDYFSHTGLNNSTPWDRACDACYSLGCGPSTAMAENIAAGNSDAQSTFTQWQNSPGHNANMLGSSFTMIGIGRATGGGTYGVYWTNVFGGATEPSCN